MTNIMNVRRLSKRRQRWIVPAGMFVIGAVSMFVVLSFYESFNLSLSTLSQARVARMSRDDTFDREVENKIESETFLAKPTDVPQKKVRILCFVKTQPKNYDTRALTIKNTWGKQCDKLLFMSSKPDAKLPAIGLFPEEDFVESRKNLTQKVFRALKYIYTRYLDDYDWFHEADDDTYIIVDNLRGFLATKNPEDPIYFGHRFMKYVPQGYTSGGAGYVMSREALRRIRDRGAEERMCNTKGTASDAHIGHCLNAVGVKLGKSVDSKGRSRYHCMDIEPFIHGGFPSWYIHYTDTGDGSRKNWMADYPISFHYIKPGKMHTLDLLLHHTRVHGEARQPRPPMD